MTDIVTIPDVLPISPYPALGSTNFNNEAYAYATSVPPAVSRMREIAVAGRTCAIAAQEYATAAQGHAGNALTYSSNAATSAGTAATQAGNALTSASNAATSAGTAATHASTAAGALAAMQVMYLGSKAVNSHPATDNMGNPLQAGAMYTNTGTNAALSKRGWWWDGAAWQLAWGDITGVYMPTTGGTFTGHINVPANATGNQAPRVSEVFKKAPDAFGKAKPMGELDVGFALFTTTSGRGGDWPPETYDDPNQAWLVETTGGAGRAKQVATQLLTTTAMTSTTGRIQGSTWQRSLEGTTWGAWDRVITARTAMDQQVTVNVPAGTTTYTLDPGLGGSHVVTINGTCTFNLPAGRQYGDQVTLDVVSAGAIRSIGFSANVKLPLDGSGAQLPFPSYPANGVVSFVFRCILVNRWECYYAGVH